MKLTAITASVAKRFPARQLIAAERLHMGKAWNPSGLVAAVRAALERFVAIFERFLPAADTGRRGERVAARYLRRQGLRILARNWRTRTGEIDIIALEADTIVFVEVKSRERGPSVCPDERGDPLDRIDGRKLRRIRSAAAAFLARTRGLYERTRLDAIVVEFVMADASKPAKAAEKVPARKVTVRWYPAIFPVERDEG